MITMPMTTRHSVHSSRSLRSWPANTATAVKDMVTIFFRPCSSKPLTMGASSRSARWR